MKIRVFVQGLGLGLILVGCSERLKEEADPIAYGINPRVVEVVGVAKQSQTSAAQNAALLGFYFNNRADLTAKDVQFIAHATQTSEIMDTILVDWSKTQRLGIPFPEQKEQKEQK